MRYKIIYDLHCKSLAQLEDVANGLSNGKEDLLMMHLVSLGWDKTVISYVEVALEHLGGVEFDSLAMEA
ncbi:hypothetical protein NC652_020475 [Populus alba x Populus x berolinensis]|uniref:Uncharacterized protein n=1 Tax=Populus alba x Populus x berolinensis TaxID=444605 RepID=A0AAD6MK56_9ROSI|nr:hypothetical protein NC652_020475 [Populus alba x Populus x berolinensis]KAJ6987034.1 hypothetical protein NC653_020302 [Populus alba x Populus x berolinensis]